MKTFFERLDSSRIFCGGFWNLVSSTQLISENLQEDEQITSLREKKNQTKITPTIHGCLREIILSLTIAISSLTLSWAHFSPSKDNLCSSVPSSFPTQQTGNTSYLFGLSVLSLLFLEPSLYFCILTYLDPTEGCYWSTGPSSTDLPHNSFLFLVFWASLFSWAPAMITFSPTAIRSFFFC